MTPKHNCFTNLWRAFLVGGIICTIGQALMNLFKSLGADKELSSSYAVLSLVLLAVLLTGFNIYPKIAKFAGAGSIVPITGFANSVAAPAVEFKKEGQVFGIGCKIFTIAGPVILYGIVSSWVLGLIYYILMKLGVV
jgi:stage V sporulation protein AC